MSYVTVAEVKTYLNVTGTTDDALLAQLIDSAQKAIETHTGRVFESTADATHYFTVGEDTDAKLLFLDADLCQITSMRVKLRVLAPRWCMTSASARPSVSS